MSDPVGTGPVRSGATAAPADGPDSGGRNRTLVVAGIVGAVLALLVVVLGLSDGGGETDTAGLVVGEQAPPLAAPTASGGEFDILDEQGRWVVVNFFATWCPPCVAEHPELVAFASRNGDDATVVSVAYDEPADVVEAFFDDNGGDWPVVPDPGSIPLDWAVVKLPESYLVDPGGTVVEKFRGGVTATELEASIAEHSGAAGDGGASG